MSENKNKKPIGKIILSILLAIVVAIGVFGTIIGIKDVVREKKRNERINNTTTEKFELGKDEKEFSTEKFSITLTEDFEIFEDSAIEIGCVAEGIEVFVYEDTFEDGSKESKMTAMEYVEDLTVDFDGSVKISEHNGVPFVEYIYQGENDEIVKNYKVFCYKGEDGFWMVHFITEIDYSLVYKPYIFEWLETIEAK